jgi:hypothetical protein
MAGNVSLGDFIKEKQSTNRKVCFGGKLVPSQCAFFQPTRNKQIA